MFDFIYSPKGYHPNATERRTIILLDGEEVGYIEQERAPSVFKPGDDARAMYAAWDPTCIVKIFDREERTFPTRAKAEAFLGRIKKR